MTHQHKHHVKSYALQRMALAIDKAIVAQSRGAKERAARWAAAWGMLGGIRTEKVRLKRIDPRDMAVPAGEPEPATDEEPACAKVGAPLYASAARPA